MSGAPEGAADPSDAAATPQTTRRGVVRDSFQPADGCWLPPPAAVCPHTPHPRPDTVCADMARGCKGRKTAGEMPHHATVAPRADLLVFSECFPSQHIDTVSISMRLVGIWPCRALITSCPNVRALCCRCSPCGGAALGATCVVVPRGCNREITGGSYAVDSPRRLLWPSPSLPTTRAQCGGVPRLCRLCTRPGRRGGQCGDAAGCAAVASEAGKGRALDARTFGCWFVCCLLPASAACCCRLWRAAWRGERECSVSDTMELSVALSGILSLLFSLRHTHCFTHMVVAGWRLCQTLFGLQPPPHTHTHTHSPTAHYPRQSSLSSSDAFVVCCCRCVAETRLPLTSLSRVLLQRLLPVAAAAVAVAVVEAEVAAVPGIVEAVKAAAMSATLAAGCKAI